MGAKSNPSVAARSAIGQAVRRRDELDVSMPKEADGFLAASACVCRHVVRVHSGDYGHRNNHAESAPTSKAPGRRRAVDDVGEQVVS